MVVAVDAPSGQGVLVDVVSASICGSDLKLIGLGAVEGRIIGHEFAGTLSDGTAVAIEPTIGCGACHYCVDGERRDCQGQKSFMGIKTDGGMAEQVLVDPMMLVVLPSGLDVGIAALVEPLAVAAHAVRRVGPLDGERVAVIGAGPIGLAVAAILRDRGVEPALFARHDHQKAAGEALGARFDGEDGFDVIFDAVGTTASIAEAVERVQPRGRLGLVGTLWEPASIDMALWSRELTIIPAAGYSGVAPNRDFDEAARVLAQCPDIAEVMVTHRFPLDGATEGFAAAADRAAGAIKVLFEV
jgi:threonine dehydrogenase-like Zn-dependent dehydrogenase